MKKIHSLLDKTMAFVLVGILLIPLFVLPAAATGDGYEYAWFPASTMDLTQLAFEGYSHGSQNAIDLDPHGDVVAPFTCKVVHADSRWGYVVLQSVDEVRYANGDLNYMTVCLMHDEDITDMIDAHKADRIIPQGEVIYQAGGMGNGNANAYGDHVHLSVFRGRATGVTSDGRYGHGDIIPYEALFINPEFTTKIENPGHAQQAVHNGSPSDYTDRWETAGYLTECTLHRTHALIKCTENTTSMTLPCSSKTCEDSKMVSSIKKGTILTATAIVENTYSNYWYRVETDDGSHAYIPANKMAFSEPVLTDITIHNASAPSSLREGNVFSIKGDISAAFNELTDVSVYVYYVDNVNKNCQAKPSTGLSVKLDTNGYSLYNSEIDAATRFDALPKGTYLYQIQVHGTTHYCNGLKELKSESFATSIYSKEFTVK